MTDTKRPRGATVLRLIEDQIAQLQKGLPPFGVLHPQIREQIAHIRGQIAALEEVRLIISGERKGFSE